MGTANFIVDLVDLLVRIEHGMSEFEEPLPWAVKRSILQAVVGFGDSAVPVLHDALVKLEHSDMAYGYLIDALGEIGNVTSVPHLIECHKRGSYQTSAAAMQALRKLKSEEGYEYMGKALIEWVAGNKRAFNSALEIETACAALGEWNDTRAIEPLERAVAIYHADDMPKVAIQQLVKYPQAHPFLHDLADSEPALREMITSAFEESQTE